jgi:hypothetical protein
MLTYSSEYLIPVSQLVEDFANGTREYTHTNRYVRGFVSNEDVENKKSYLIFSDSDESPYVQILEPILFFVNEEGKQELIQGNNRVRALFEMLQDPKYKDLEYKPVPYKVVETWTIDDLYTLQVSLNDATTEHKPIALARIILKRKQELIEFYSTSNLNKKAQQSTITNKLKTVFQVKTDAHLGRLLRAASQPEFVQDLLDKEIITITDVVVVDQLAAKVGQSTEEIFKDLTNLAGEGEKIPSKLRDVYLAGKTESKETSTSETSTSETKTAESGEKLPIHKTPTEFVESLENLLNKYSCLPSIDLKEHSTEVTKVVKTNISAILKTLDLLGSEEIALIFPIFFDLSTRLLGNPEVLKERAIATDSTLGSIYENLVPLQKAVDSLYNKIYNPQPEKVSKKKSSESPLSETALSESSLEVIEVPEESTKNYSDVETPVTPASLPF